ncbi:MAG TPA: hypothetical protein VNA88_14665 [Candidatus Kapabacteria bacterium]|jgi:hypothetical protein|nr:hypothetical protein [Candidatus Kapabacteria bacterium]
MEYRYDRSTDDRGLAVGTFIRDILRTIPTVVFTHEHWAMQTVEFGDRHIHVELYRDRLDRDHRGDERELLGLRIYSYRKGESKEQVEPTSFVEQPPMGFDFDAISAQLKTSIGKYKITTTVIDEKEISAYHEAGHAVAQLRMCGFVERCDIDDGEPREGEWMGNSGKMVPGSDHYRPDHLAHAQDRIDMICVNVAGMVAQNKKFGVKPHNWGDPRFDFDSRAVIEHTDGLLAEHPNLDRDGIERTIVTSVEALMGQPDVWSRVTKIAEDLLRQRMLERAYFETFDRVEYVPLLILDDLPRVTADPDRP